MKTKVRYCVKCEKDTVHELVSREAMCEGLGLIRVMMCVSTLGITETLGVTKHYQCRKCGNLKKID